MGTAGSSDASIAAARGAPRRFASARYSAAASARGGSGPMVSISGSSSGSGSGGS